jgi:hypothetical protein
LAFEDYRLNAQLRALFVRRWVDLSLLDYGVTNGVVYLRGSLRQYVSLREAADRKDSVDEALILAAWVERAIRQMPGVRDVVFNLDNMVRVGSKWRSR